MLEGATSFTCPPVISEIKHGHLKDEINSLMPTIQKSRRIPPSIIENKAEKLLHPHRQPSPVKLAHPQCPLTRKLELRKARLRAVFFWRGMRRVSGGDDAKIGVAWQ